jgi:hypothetical protein
VFVALFGLAAANATGCVQLNASHCANLQGTATCEERGAGVCSKCTSENDGCVESVDASCAADVGATESGTTTESVTATGSTTVGMSMSSTSATSSSSGDVSGEETSVLPKMDGLPFCGDGEKNSMDEFCDTDDYGGLTCMGLGFVAGDLRCTEDCQVDTELCQGAPPCGNGEIADDEQCDGMMLDGATCESEAGAGYTGELACNPFVCQYDTTACCKPAGVECTAQDTCCEGLTCKLAVLPLFTCQE